MADESSIILGKRSMRELSALSSIFVIVKDKKELEISAEN